MINACTCMGCIGSDPYCPCKMKQLGLTPTELWTPEKIAEFEKCAKQNVWVD
jgi:hypothetical protein